MSQNFPTHKQFIAQVRARLQAEYPDAAKSERGLFKDCVAMNTDEGAWLRHLGELVTQGVQAEQPVLDTLTPEQLHSLKTIYAPRETLDWYIPVTHRTNHSLEPRRLTPEALFVYARAYAKRHEDKGRGTRYPTFALAAKHFHVRLSDIETACQDWNGEGYMSAAVGFRIGSGTALYGRKGAWEVEAYV